MSGTSTQSLEDHIDELEMNVLRLEQHAEYQACLLKRAEEEIWNGRAGTEGFQESIRKREGLWHHSNSVRLMNLQPKNGSSCLIDAAIQFEII